jgi:DNA-directed RNA polymerase specialized sigma24 family protein
MGSPRDQPLADIEAFVALYREHAEALLVFFARRTLDAEAAADLTGETFAQALASRHRFRDHGDGAAPWLYGIAQHQLSRFYRRGKAGAKRANDLACPRGPSCRTTSCSASRSSSTSRRRLPRCGARWPTCRGGLRDAVALRIVDSQPYAAIAAELGCSEQAARLRVSRGLRRLATTIRFAES